MQITTSQGEMILDDDKIPSANDMIDIIGSVVEEEFVMWIWLEATDWPDDLTCAQFLARVEKLSNSHKG